MHRARLEGLFGAYAVAARVMADPAIAERWGEPSALPGLTVGGVAAHLSAAMRRFEVALDEEVAEPAKVLALPEFYGLNRMDSPDDRDAGWHPLLQEDAERRAARGAATVASRFAAIGPRLEERLRAEPADRLIPVWTVPHGATPLAQYVATRVVELVVHTDDLVVSAGLTPVPIPREAASVVIEACVEMARHRSGDLDVIRAFARAERAPAGALRVL